MLFSSFTALGASIPVLLLNLDAKPLPSSMLWKLALASLEAGIQEENFYRLFVMSFLVWLMSVKSRTQGLAPSSKVYWIAIVLTGILFGWAHIDEKVGEAGASVPPSVLANAMTLVSLLGIAFGWLYWKWSIECAILAHTLVDVVGTTIVVPTYLSDNSMLQVVAVITFALAGYLGWRLIRKACHQVLPYG